MGDCVVHIAPVLVNKTLESPEGPVDVLETNEIDGSRRLSINRDIIVVDILS